MSNSILYEINLENLQDSKTLNYIYNNKTDNYYLSLDFTKEFYIAQAKAGFIATSVYIKDIFYLLPEIQFEYAVLDFKNLHICKKVEKLLNKSSFRFVVNSDINLVLEEINSYHKDSWLCNRYRDLILDLYKNPSDGFEIYSVLLYFEDKIIAGEIGYKIKSTYTSLSGFSSKDRKFNNWGKLQLVLLAKYLEENAFSFWNLGHPYMQYKFDLGAKLYKREEFLKRWLDKINS